MELRQEAGLETCELAPQLMRRGGCYWDPELLSTVGV